ncbi:MAG: MBL fold metallo-hydrolase [Propionibacteriaceae bacterium]|nr:MBL fold metallo-hydrolase [Propionibacteriaceae bacterium]
MELAANLRRVGNDIVACYLVADGTGVTLVDAGLAGQWDEFLAELAAMGHSPADVKAVLLTHGDEDHIGFAERLRREHGIPVWVHEADAGRARGEGKPPTGWGHVRPAALFRFLAYAARKGGLRTTYLASVRTFGDGAVLDVPGSPRVIPLPGHSPGSVGYYFAGVDALFVGDALTTRHVLTGADGPAAAPFTDDPAQADASLAELEGVTARWVLPGHGTPWTGGVAEAVRRYRASGH